MTAIAAPSLAPPRAAAGEGVMAVLARLADEAGVPPTRLMADLAALALGPGRIALSDYQRLRLHDEGFWGLAERRCVVGAKRSRELARAANFRHDWFAVASDRLVAGAYLAAHGLPAVPTLAVFRAGLAAPGERLLRTREELRQFLEGRIGQPTVARPSEGGRARLVFVGGRADPSAEIDRLVDEACDTPGVSWILQPRLTPHPASARKTGGRLAPVRLVTAAGERGARVLRAVWRLGGPDDVVASLDLKTGQALQVFPAAAPERARLAPADLVAPDWAAVRAAAVEGARLYSPLGLIGWDVTATEDGPVILGLDPAPDLALCQLADRRGLLDAPFLAFLDERRRLASDWRRAQADSD